MSTDPLQEAIAASFQDRIAPKDGPIPPGPTAQSLTKEQGQTHLDKDGEQATTAPPPPPPRYSIDDCIRELSAVKPPQLPHICDPTGDTWIFIDPPAKQPEQTRVDYDEYRRKFEQPYRMDSVRLSQASPFFRDRLAPTAQYRTRRRRRLAAQLPPGIKYVLDLTPPSEGDDAVYLTASLCCPEGVRFWYQAGDIWQISDSLVGGQEEYHSREGGAFRKLIASPLEYSPIGHRSAIERVLAAIQGMNVTLDSAVKVWMMTVIAEHFRITQATCTFLTDTLLTWLRAEPNIYFLEINPEISLRMGKIIQNVNLYRDAFAILVGEEALDSLVRDRLHSSQKQTFSTCGRRKVDLPEELVQRIEYASKAFIERNLSDFDRMVDSEMLWLEHLPTIKRLATFTDQDLAPIAVSLKVITKCFMRHILLHVLCNGGASFTGLRLPNSTGELLLPHMKRKTSWSHLSFKERLFTRTFWATLDHEMQRLRQDTGHTAPHKALRESEDIITRSLQEQYVPSYSVDDHPYYPQSHLLEVAAKGQAILSRKASTNTYSETRLSQQGGDPIEIADYVESEGPKRRLPFRTASFRTSSQQSGDNILGYDHELSDGNHAPRPVEHQYENLVAHPNVDWEANPAAATQSSMSWHGSGMTHRAPTRDQIAARMAELREEQERIDGQQDQAWMEWKAHMDGQGEELMDDINASKSGSSVIDVINNETTQHDERPFPWEWDGDMGESDSPTLGLSPQNEPPGVKSAVFPLAVSSPPPRVPFFDIRQFLREAASHVSNVAHPKVSVTDAGPRADTYHPGVINTLICLDETEWKYCPLEFGGYDDGTGAVFSDDIMEAMPDAGFSTAGPSIHTGGSTYSHADSNDFDMLSDAGSSAGTINTSTAVADGYSDQLDRHRTYAISSVGAQSDDLEMDATASSDDDEVRLARQQIQALEFTEAADAKAAAAARAAADKGKLRADAIDSDYSDLFDGVDPADDDDGDEALDYDSDDTERGDGFELI